MMVTTSEGLGMIKGNNIASKVQNIAPGTEQVLSEWLPSWQLLSTPGKTWEVYD